MWAAHSSGERKSWMTKTLSASSCSLRMSGPRDEDSVEAPGNPGERGHFKQTARSRKGNGEKEKIPRKPRKSPPGVHSGGEQSEAWTETRPAPRRVGFRAASTAETSTPRTRLVDGGRPSARGPVWFRLLHSAPTLPQRETLGGGRRAFSFFCCACQIVLPGRITAGGRHHVEHSLSDPAGVGHATSAATGPAGGQGGGADRRGSAARHARGILRRGRFDSRQRRGTARPGGAVPRHA